MIYTYRGIGPAGSMVTSQVEAANADAVVRQLAREGVTVINVWSVDASRQRIWWRRADLSGEERILVLRHLGVTTGAGVALLDSLNAVADALGEGPAAIGVRKVVSELQRGGAIDAAFRAGLPGYPDYVYALIATGAASGRLPQILEEATTRLAADAAIRRDIVGALAYPAFLVAAAYAAFLFLFSSVAPRFVGMIGDRRDSLDGMSQAVLNVAAAFQNHPAQAFAIALGLPLAIAAIGAAPGTRVPFTRLASTLPVVKGLLRARAVASWARVMAFALAAGLGVVRAAELAAAAVTHSMFRDALHRAGHTLRTGRPVADSYAAEGVLDPIDQSLLRTGESSGSLGAMFSVIAERHEDQLRRRLKLTMVVLEQAAIGIVALLIGIVVISLVTAITALYDSVGPV